MQEYLMVDGVQAIADAMVRTGLPVGGEADAVLAKNSAADFDAGWIQLSGIAQSGQYGDLIGAPVLAPVATSGQYADLTGAPNLAPVATSGQYTDLTGTPNLAAVATSGQYADLAGKPNIALVATTGQYTDLTGVPSLATVATSGQYADLAGKPVLAPVATSGQYSDLTGLPSLAPVATSGQYADLAGTPNLATVATSGSYTDLANQPTIPMLNNTLTSTSVTQALTAAQGKALNDLITVINNAGYVDGDQVNTIVSTAVENAIGGLMVFVDALPDTGELGKIYLVTSSGGDDLYDEYVWDGTQFDKIGALEIDLSGYLQIVDAATQYVAKTITINGKPLSANVTLTAADVGAAAVSHTHDASGITSGTLDPARIPALNQNTTGNAATATKLQIARTLAFTGDATGSGTFDGSTNYSAALTLATVATAGSTGEAANKALTYGGTFVIPQITINAKGLTTAATARTMTMPAAPTTIPGNAATASKLETARTIGISGKATGTATSFDGSGNITIPVTAVTDAATLTTARTIAISGKATGTATSFNGSTNITIPITDLAISAADVPTLNQSTTGNAGTATKLQTSRTINGVAFDGTGNITVADNTKLPLAGGTMTGTIANATNTIINKNVITSTYINGFRGVNVAVNDTTTAGAYNVLYSAASTNGRFAFGVYQNAAFINYQTKTVIDAGTNSRAVDFLFNEDGTTNIKALSLVNARAFVTNLASTASANFDGTANNTHGVTGVLPVANGGTGNTSGNTAGNASTASTLQTARTIALSGKATGTATSFNGSANITIPVTALSIAAADVPTLNQNTTGSAATLTTARTVQTNLASTAAASFNGSANITPGVTGVLPIANGGTGNTTGNAATATTLQTARTIGLSGKATGTATSFNGSANITIPVTALSITPSDVPGVVSQVSFGTISVGTTGWTKGADNLYRQDITNAAVTAAMHVIIGPTSASAANISLVGGETSAGKYMLIATAVPTAACTLNVWILKAN
ncbi:hypothetical protein AGMMS49992_25760 [Clostridia bacterium]|nr:hypothetical protein AGMMS49992_25760 [Clostridia bacterium]